MSQQVLPVVGAIVGAFYGGPSGAQLGWAVGAAIGGIAASTESKPGPRLGELPAQSFDEGVPRAIVYGTSQTSGYVIAAAPAIKTTEYVDGGGKGGGSVETEVAYRSYAIAMCEGPIEAVLRVWADDKLVYDVRPESMMQAESARWIENKQIYLGDEDQLPDVFLQLNVTGQDTPAYRGTAYMVFGLEDLSDRRGTIPMYRFEVARSAQGVEVELEKIPSIGVDGGLIGGSFDSTPWLSGGGSMTGNGKAWLAVWRFNSASSSNITLLVDIGGSIFYSSPVFVEIGGWREFRVQINANPGAIVKMGFVGPINTSLRFGFFGLDSPYAFNAYGGGQVAPDYYEPDSEFFGVLSDGVALYAADDIEGDWGVAWGPDSFYEGAQGQPDSLDFIVGDLCSRAGLLSSEYDVEELDNPVAGLTLAGDYTAASAIDVLRSCYFFDKAEPGDKLHFPKRGKAVALTLDIDDLVEAPDMSRREQASEVPKKLHLHYANATAGYAPIKTTYTRSSQDIQSNLETSLQVPVVLDTDAAAQMVDKMFKVTSADAQGEIKLSIPSSFIRLVASDCIGLNLRGQVRRLRIDDIEMADGVMHLTCRADRQSAYTSILTGIPVDPPLLPPSTIPGETVYAVLDIPARIDSEDDLNYLVAGTGASEGWTGWSYQRSFDGGANFSTVRSITANAVVGRLLDPISAASEHYTDATNVVRVQLVNANQVIEGQTVQAFLSESGAFALEGASGWEILQYLDADDEGDGVFALSVLHRGLLNTAPTDHIDGALFVLLDRASHIPAQAAWIGQDLTHRGVSIGNTVEGAVITTETFTGQSQIEWPVSYLTLGRDSSDVITGQWVPRHRFGADVNPVASINFQGFRVTLDDGADTVSFDVLAPSFTYDASAMAAPVDVSVAPINRITGAGPAVTESI